MYNYVRGILKDIANYDATRPVLKLYYSSRSMPEGDPIYFRDSDYNEFISGLETREGFVNYYWNDNKGRLYLELEDVNSEF